MAIKKKKGGAVAGSDNEKLSVALDIGSSTLRIIAGHVTEDLQIKVKGYLEFQFLISTSWPLQLPI